MKKLLFGTVALATMMAGGCVVTLDSPSFDAEELWDTTMNPQTRILLQVRVDDAAAVNDTFEKLMGPDVEPRKKFIQAHAKSVRNLDI